MSDKIQFKVGNKYENRKGVFEVISIKGDSMIIQWEKGEKISTNIEFQQRIIEEIEKELAILAKEPEIGLDIETHNLKPWTLSDLTDKHPFMKLPSRILSIAIGTDKHTVVFPIEHPLAWSGNYEPVKESGRVGLIAFKPGWPAMMRSYWNNDIKYSNNYSRFLLIFEIFIFFSFCCLYLRPEGICD